MVNLNLFRSRQTAPAADTRNEAGGLAYRFGPKHQLAQYAMTGCLTQTFYASADTQLEQVLAVCQQLEPEFIAKTAIYARQKGYMKDVPALLCASLCVRGSPYLPTVFAQVIDNGKMLRNFVQIIRSGVLGRKSLGTRPKKLVQNWLLQANERQLLNAAVGNSPSLGDVLKMVHPKPAEPWRAAWFAWLIGKPYPAEHLPELTQAFERYKQQRGELPDVPFQMLTALELSAHDWAKIAQRSSWQTLRQNLNTLQRHGVYQLPGMVNQVAKRLSDAQAIAKARVMPYQLLTTYQAIDKDLPAAVQHALHEAMEQALHNVPRLSQRVVICPDVSGSMSSVATGYRKGATSKTRCIDIAALVAAAFMRRNRDSVVLPFEHEVVKLKLDPKAAVLDNATRLASIGGGGTNCSAPLAWLNQHKQDAELVVMVSDNESWIDSQHRGATQTLKEWEQFKRRNPKARLVCIDIQPYGTAQAPERQDILNVGGFSDQVFSVIERFVSGQLSAQHWVGEIEQIPLQ